MLDFYKFIDDRHRLLDDIAAYGRSRHKLLDELSSSLNDAQSHISDLQGAFDVLVKSQLSNVANKGWYVSGQGQEVDINEALQPFVEKNATAKRPPKLCPIYPSLDWSRFSRLSQGSRSKRLQTLQALESNGKYVEAARNRLEYFKEDGDEIVLTASDWRSAFPNAQGHHTYNPWTEINDGIDLSNLKWFTHISCDSHEPDSGDTPQRRARIINALEENLIKALDEEESMHQQLKNMAISKPSKDQLRGLRQAIRSRDEMKKALPGGLSACRLTPPPPPVRHDDVVISEFLPAKQLDHSASRRDVSAAPAKSLAELKSTMKAADPHTRDVDENSVDTFLQLFGIKKELLASSEPVSFTKTGLSTKEKFGPRAFACHSTGTEAFAKEAHKDFEPIQQTPLIVLEDTSGKLYAPDETEGCWQILI